MEGKYQPRITVIVPEELNRRITNKIPWGIKSSLLCILLEDLMDLVDEHGEIVLAAILQRKIKARDIMKGLKEDTSGT